MVGCWKCTYPSIHFFVSRSRSVVDRAHIQAFTLKLPQDHGRLSGVWCCGGGGVVWWWCALSLSLALSLSPAISLLLSLSCSLSFLFSFPFAFPFFFSLNFLFLSPFSFSFSLAPSLTLALALVLSLSLLSSFFPSTHSSLLFPSRQQTLYKALINKHGVQL